MTAAQKAMRKTHSTQSAVRRRKVSINMPTNPEPVSVKDMMLRTIVLMVTINGIGNYRKVDPTSLNITDAQSDKDVNKDWFGVHKKLMKSPELKKIQSIGNKAKAYVFSRALPFSLKSGIYLLPRGFQEEMNAKLKGFQAEMLPEIESLASNLPEYKREAKREQGPQFNESQFPTVEKIKGAFRISWRFLFIESAQGLSKELYEEERKKAEAEWAETRDIIQHLLRTQLSEMVNHMVDKLTPVNGLVLNIGRTEFDELNGNIQGFAVGREIAVSPIAAIPHKTTFHEIAHCVLGHTTEEKLVDSDATPMSLREVEAEAVALICCETLSLDGAEYARGYIQHWLEGQKDVPNHNAARIFTAASTILKAGNPAAGSQ